MRLRFHTMDDVQSTNDELLARAARGETEGYVLSARRQTQGRGRHRHRWLSPAGNLYSSLLLTPNKDKAEMAQLSLVCGVAFYHGLERLSQRRVQLKWPNDLLIGGRKIGGCLIEHHPPFVIVGLGINIRCKPAASEVSWQASCLAEEGFPPFDAFFLAQHLWVSFVAFYQQWQNEGFAAMRDLWLARAFALGDEWRCEQHGRLRQGRFSGMSEEGAMLLTPAGAHAPLVIHSARELALATGEGA